QYTVFYLLLFKPRQTYLHLKLSLRQSDKQLNFLLSLHCNLSNKHSFCREQANLSTNNVRKKQVFLVPDNQLQMSNLLLKFVGLVNCQLAPHLSIYKLILMDFPTIWFGFWFELFRLYL